jgi:hypothetical protein
MNHEIKLCVIDKLIFYILLKISTAEEVKFMRIHNLKDINSVSGILYEDEHMSSR